MDAGAAGPDHPLRGDAGDDGWSVFAIASADPASWTIVAGDAAEPPPGASDRAAARRDPVPGLPPALAATRPRRTDSLPAGLPPGPAPGPAPGVPAPPFRRGWIGVLGYELGRTIEPAARHAAVRPDPAPRLALARAEGAILHHRDTGTWWSAGDHGVVAGLLGELAAAADPIRLPRLGGFSASLDAEAHEAAVARALGFVAAGDIFQVNLARMLAADFEGSARGLARRLLRASAARRGAVIEVPGGPTIVSASPELFLEVRSADGRVRTRPIKGTRPLDRPAAELRDAAKDRAELAMIVDLMRNDLGRVAELGSVRVTEPRRIVELATVRHAVAEVQATLAEGRTTADLLAATFPCGSITGCPKIRAMQVIEILEPVSRGPYCGAVGCFDDDGDVRLNVAIRTATVDGERPGADFDALRGRLRYGAGGGIVADSAPAAELAECRDKTRVLERALGYRIDA